MRHDWVFDVLSDLLSYATRNGLPLLAAKVLDAIDEARREIDATGDGADDPAQTASLSDRPMH